MEELDPRHPEWPDAAASEQPEEETASEAAPEPAGVRLRWVLELCLPLVVLLLLVYLFVFRLMLVSGTSMLPTLHDGELIGIRLLGYTPQQGDVVVIRTEKDGRLGGESIVKRVIAVGGQSVLIDYENDVVYINGIALEEPYLHGSGEDQSYREDALYIVPEGEIFVLGDNRSQSLDSRDPMLGTVPVRRVTGVVCLHIPLKSDT